MRRTADLEGPRFDGQTFDPAMDQERLTKQLGRVWFAAFGERWQTLEELEQKTGDPQASISSRLRDLRKQRFGGYDVQRRRRKDAGLWEYRVRAAATPELPLFPQLRR